MSEQWTSESESEDDVIVETDEETDVKEEVKEKVEEEVKELPKEKPEKKKVGRPRKPKVVKEKKKPSEAQLQALARGRAKRDAGRLERKTTRKKQLEEKVVKKAINLKKREVLEEAILVFSSEDEMDDLELQAVKRAVAKRKSKKNNPPKQVKNDYEEPQYVFY